MRLLLWRLLAPTDALYATAGLSSLPSTVPQRHQPLNIIVLLIFQQNNRTAVRSWNGYYRLISEPILLTECDIPL